MTQRALNAERVDSSPPRIALDAIEETGETHDRVEAKKIEGDSRVFEIDHPTPQSLNETGG